MDSSDANKETLNRNQTTSGNEENTFASLLDRVSKLEIAIQADRKSWLRVPSNIISLTAVVVTLAIFAVTFTANKQSAQFEKRQSLSSVIAEISALTQEEVNIVESSMSERARMNSQTGIANRRVALVRKADALLAEVPEGISKLDMTILAAAYASIGRLEEAEQHYRDLAESKSEPPYLRLMALRSLISLYTVMGEERIADATAAYEAGMDLIRSADTQHLANSKSSMAAWLSEVLLTYRRYEEARPFIIAGERAAWLLPCQPYRNTALNLIESQIRRLLVARPDFATTLNAQRAKYPEGCVINPPLVGSDFGDKPLSFDGTYTGPGGTLVISRKREEQLFAEIPGRMPPSLLRPLGDKYYNVVNVPNVYLSVQQSSSGDANAIHLVQPDRVYVLERSLD